MKYIKKPLEIEAIDAEDLLDCCRGCAHAPYMPKFIEDAMCNGAIHINRPHLDDASIEIITLEGVMTAGKDDMIIQGIHGEIYPCKKDIFFESYNPSSEI